MIDSGAYERHVRRLRRAHERRRSALLEAVARHLPAGAHAVGAAAGLHVVVWLPFLRPVDEPAMVAAARERGVGVYAVSPLYARPRPRTSSPPAGLILGYASLAVDQIEQGLRVLAEAVASVQGATLPR